MQPVARAAQQGDVLRAQTDFLVQLTVHGLLRGLGRVDAALRKLPGQLTGERALGRQFQTAVALFAIGRVDVVGVGVVAGAAGAGTLLGALWAWMMVAGDVGGSCAMALGMGRL